MPYCEPYCVELQAIIKYYLNGVSDTDIEGLMALYDTSGDGKVSYAEFLHAVTNPSYLDAPPAPRGAALLSPYAPCHAQTLAKLYG
jgi:hypothetical protein